MCMVCPDCRKTLFQPTAFTTLLETGLKFQKSLTRLRSISQRDCHVCALLRSVVLECPSIGRGEDENFRFDVAVWGSGSPTVTFTLKAVVDHEKLVHDFVRFDVYFLQFGPTSFWGKSRNLIIRPESPASHIKFARRWIEDCTKFHPHCQDLVETILPTRVLEVLQADGTPNLKLRETGGAHGCYMALSYCWGQPQPARLTNEKFYKYVEAIEKSTLPLTIREFIGIARELGVRFVWVDAYCILQDNDEDKHREIGNMNEIYKSSFLTIIASKATSVSDGFVDWRHRVWPSWDVPFQLLKGKNVVFTLQQIPHLHLDEEPISGRAWTLQERLLSPRTISFLSGTPALEWRCESIHESNIGPIERLYHSDVRLYSSILPRTSAITATLAEHRLCYRWAKIVEIYSERALTDLNDKLPAIGGIAQEFSIVLASTYYTGLWGRFFLTQLLWKALGSPRKPNKRASKYRAPSWSWASMDGPVELCHHPHPSAEPVLTILSCDVILRDKSRHFGAILAGTLTVKGRLKLALVRDEELFDVETKQRLARSRFDSQLSPEPTLVWCLLSRNESSDDWEVETLTSETSEDYPDYLCALLLTEGETEVKRTFQRVGITDYFFEKSLQWFEGVVEELIDII